MLYLLLCFLLQICFSVVFLNTDIIGEIVKQVSYSLILYNINYIFKIIFICLGNRYILPIWIKTPAKQSPLDLKELEPNFSKPKPVYDSGVPQEFVELHKKESDI